MGSSRLPALVIKLTQTHLAFYHTEHPHVGLFDLQSRCHIQPWPNVNLQEGVLASMKCSAEGGMGGGDGVGGGGGRMNRFKVQHWK